MGCHIYRVLFEEKENEIINDDEINIINNFENPLSLIKDFNDYSSTSNILITPNKVIPISINDFKKELPLEIQEYLKENNSEISNSYEGNINNLFLLQPILLNNNYIYWGYWNKDFNLEGPGKLFLREEKIFYDGLFKNNIIYKAKIFLNEGIYYGEIKNNKINGKGKMNYSNGDFFDGNWVDKKKVGNGIFIYKDGCKYIGQFSNDKFNGDGEFIWINGFNYKGNFNNGIPEGKGIFKGNNGSIYIGDFQKGYFHGNGKFIFGNNNINGNINNYANNALNNDNNNNNLDNNNNDDDLCEKYIGEFAFGKKEGNGVYHFINGDKFSGVWFNDFPQGRGIYETKKNIYKGLWKYGEILEEPVIINKIYDSNEEKVPNLNFKTRNFNLDLFSLDHLNEYLKNSSQNTGIRTIDGYVTIIY